MGSGSFSKSRPELRVVIQETSYRQRHLPDGDPAFCLQQYSLTVIIGVIPLLVEEYMLGKSEPAAPLKPNMLPVDQSGRIEQQEISEQGVVVEIPDMHF